jgi:hypothetical protein
MRFAILWRGHRPGRQGRPAPEALHLRTLEDRTLLSISLFPDSNVLVHPRSGNQSETAIAMNPTIPGNLFAVSNDPTQSNLGGYYSFDGGVTWGTSVTNNIPATCCDAQTAWDSFGNLFVVYLNRNDTAVVTVMSTDGGVHFSVIDSTAGGFDQPSVAVGPSGFGDGSSSVWIDYNAGGPMRVKGAQVTGLGAVGSFTTPMTALTGSFGNIAVGPYGEVMVAVENPTGGAGPANLLESVNPNGLAGPAFGPAVLVTSTNVGGFLSLPVQPFRDIDAEFNVAFDNSGGPYTGRVYAVYVNRSSLSSTDTNIYVMYSDVDGAAGTWSPPVLVNDDGTSNSHFNPAIAIDQSVGTSTSGFVALTWYDCRNSPGNNSAEVWGTVLDGTTYSGTYQLVVQPNVPISTGGLINADSSDPAFEFGDYDLMDFNNGTFYRTWADNVLPGHSGVDMATAPVYVVVDGGGAPPSPHGNNGRAHAPTDAAGLLQARAPAAPLSGPRAETPTPAILDQVFAMLPVNSERAARHGWWNTSGSGDLTEEPA